MKLFCSRIAGLKEQRDKLIQEIASIPPASNLVVLDQQTKESMASYDRSIMYCQTQMVTTTITTHFLLHYFAPTCFVCLEFVYDL